jgi:hypothetical protein
LRYSGILWCHLESSGKKAVLLTMIPLQAVIRITSIAAPVIAAIQTAGVAAIVVAETAAVIKYMGNVYSKQFGNWLGCRGEVRGVYTLVHEHTKSEG